VRASGTIGVPLVPVDKLPKSSEESLTVSAPRRRKLAASNVLT